MPNATGMECGSNDPHQEVPAADIIANHARVFIDDGVRLYCCTARTA